MCGQTYRHTDIQDNYCSPRCSARRGLNIQIPVNKFHTIIVVIVVKTIVNFRGDSFPRSRKVGKMADSAPPRAKKAKRSAPISRVSAEERAKQFKDDLYADGGVLFCKYCAHSVDYTRVDTIKDHLKGKKHCAEKCSQQSKETASGAVADRLPASKSLYQVW